MTDIGKYFFVLSFVFISLHTFAQTNTSQVSDIEIENQPTVLPSQGDNFGFSYSRDLVGSANYYFGEGDGSFTALFLHKGINDNVGFTIGTANSDVYKPEVLYFTPSFSFSLSDKIHFGLEFRTGYSIDAEDIIMSPGFQVSFGSKEKHFSLGYSAATDFEEFETMGFAGDFYLDAVVKFGGRLPITENVALLSRNSYAQQSFFGNDISTIVSRSGLDITIDDFSIQLMLLAIRSSFDGNSNTDTKGIVGLSYRF